MANPKIAVFASGSGSNFQALADATKEGRLSAEIVLVVTDQPNAYVLERAKAAGIATLALKPREFADKAAYEEAILEKLHEQKAEWLILAGYMRLIGPTLLRAFPERIINIHPSLLPDFPGKDAIGQTLASGTEAAGVTVHFVDEGMDTGPIIAQRSFRITSRDRETVETMIHRIEHELYPDTLQQLFSRL